MRLRCGVDAASISRLAEVNPRIRARFIQRVFTAAEQAQARGSNVTLTSLFAAKEAASKALGTGIGKVHWQDFEILHRPTGEPRIRLHGLAKHIAGARNLNKWAVSITHEGNLVVASVVAIGKKRKK